jgi:hypothetical protein
MLLMRVEGSVPDASVWPSMLKFALIMKGKRPTSFSANDVYMAADQPLRSAELGTFHEAND